MTQIYSSYHERILMGHNLIKPIAKFKDDFVIEGALVYKFLQNAGNQVKSNTNCNISVRPPDLIAPLTTQLYSSPAYYNILVVAKLVLKLFPNQGEELKIRDALARLIADRYWNDIIRIV